MPRRALTLLELAIALAVVTVLLAVLVPALSSARRSSHRDQCRQHQRVIGAAWMMYLEDHEGAFPYVPVQPGWRHLGVRFSAVDDRAVLDTERPLSPYLHVCAGEDAAALACCPADRGITDETGTVGTGRRTACRSFGTSYRANDALLDSARAGLDGTAGRHGSLRLAEISTAPSRLVLQGDPLWYEVRERTGREADWHDNGRANLLFLDGSVKAMAVTPRPGVGPAVFDPRPRDAAPEG